MKNYLKITSLHFLHVLDHTLADPLIVANNRVSPSYKFKLPSFWKHSAEGWIALVQMKFRINGFESQIDRYLAVLEAFTQKIWNVYTTFQIPKIKKCYDKLITLICTIFARDQTERIELLLQDLTLGDRYRDELIRHLIVVAGTDKV